MKGICASPSSTAICSSMDRRSMVRHGTKPLNHHHHSPPHRRSRTRAPLPCSSQLPIIPRPYHQKSRKSTSKEIGAMRKKSSADHLTDLNSTSPPGSSSRYLLSDAPFFAISSDSDHLVSALVPTQVAKTRPLIASSSDDSTPPLKSSLSSTHYCDQVVVLRVSLHCKGCESKVRKHISRMEGVKSFSIDFEDKKVTIIGDVTPLAVLASVSKVKNAQLWPSQPLSSPLFPSPSVARVNYSS